MWKNLTLEKVGARNSSIFGASSREKSYASYIVVSSLLACILLYFIEQRIGSYISKTGIKLLVFLLIPAIYYFLKRDKNVYIGSSRTNEKKSLFIGFLFGILSFVILMGAYFYLQSFIDFETIINELGTKLKVTPLNFLIIGIYITLFNSFIEEFFFRGFVFLGIYRSERPIAAYLYSSLLFSLYHIMIFRNWFTLPLFILALFGLFVVGLIFNWMDTKSKNLLNSWIAHIFADAAIILIGLKMFGIIKF